MVYAIADPGPAPEPESDLPPEMQAWEELLSGKTSVKDLNEFAATWGLTLSGNSKKKDDLIAEIEDLLLETAVSEAE
jgi:hypothetical protein